MIHTNHVYPPIPIRSKDWIAYIDPEGPTGEGPTEEAAIEDLLEQYSFHDILHDAKKAVAENVRHSEESLRELLWKWFPDVPDDVIDRAVGVVL